MAPAAWCRRAQGGAGCRTLGFAGAHHPVWPPSV